MNFGRIPVIPLSYSEKHKAVPKEIMVDYETGNIYIVSATDKSVIFDITSQIKDKIDSLDGGKIDIEIEGIGKVSLNEILSRLNNEIEDSVQIIDTDEDVSYVGQESVPDNLSIEFEGRNLQIKDFKKAPNLSILRKKDGKIEWVDADIFNDIVAGDPVYDGEGNIIPPSNPNDGRILYCYDLEPLNDKIFLRASKRQKSYYITHNCKIVLPKTLDEFSEIEWYVVTNSFAPTFEFPDGIVWRNNAYQPVTDGHQVYKFKTWDYGATWIGELAIYDGNKSSHGLDTSYIDDNFYNKETIDRLFYNKHDIEDIYVAKDTLESDYLTNKDIAKKYFDKDEIKKLLSWKRPNKNGGDK